MSALPGLTLIPAGAGSGKTFRIKEQLSDWVEAGLVSPERIAAVTFTESAAGELRERIRATLMARGRLEEALRLDQSFISTIHGFGHRLLIEYAFEAGLCPTPRLLAEDEEQMLLRKAIARIDRIESVGRNLFRFGYRYSHGDGLTDVEQFRRRILSAIHMLRVIGGVTDRRNRLKRSLAYIEKTYGPSDDGDTLTDALRHGVQRLLKKYPDCMRDYAGSRSARDDLESDFRLLEQAAYTDGLNDQWSLWQNLTKLKVYKRGGHLPDDYQNLAKEVIAHAQELPRHPGPLKDALQHAGILLESAWDGLADYAQRKREKGIIDYTDMIDGARLLLEQPGVIAHLSGRFDCLVIDEFQDTNPLQFSLLWKLHEAGVPALIVGDLKQSIMGFQTADPRLMAALLSQNPGHCQPLEGNWRSQDRLMNVINAFGGQLFGEAYCALAPKAPYQSRITPLEAIRFEGPGVWPRVKSQHVAARIQALLADDTIQVFDRHLNRHRRIRGEDIAILGLTHKRLRDYADNLRTLGIRTRIAQDGWFESRPIQLAYYGLSFVADPQDRHAALYLAVTELGEDDLTSATQTLLQGGELQLPVLRKLKALAAQQDDLSVDELVTATLEQMAMFDRVAVWPDANQHRANLLRLIAEARTFVDTDREALAGGGFFGSGLKTFLAWLVSQLGGKEGDRQPDAQVHDQQAVQLMTWHSAKGKEWPIVVVATLDGDVKGRLPSLDIQYTDFSDLNRILDKAWLQFSPQFVSTETRAQFTAPLSERAREEGYNLLYVALTRARERLILEWPQNLQDSARFTYWHLLQDAAKANLDGNKLSIGPHEFTCRVTAADREPPDVFASPAAPPVTTLPQLGRRALKSGITPHDLTPAFIAPSRLHGLSKDVDSTQLVTTRYGDPLDLAMESGAQRGLMIHRILELCGLGVAHDRIKKMIDPEPSRQDWDQIRKMAETFLQVLHEKYKPSALHWEVPITSTNREHSVIGGTIDLLVETENGVWIIDHKSDEPQDLEETFNHYLPQLDCYASALADGMGLKVCGLAVHWACMGAISSLTVNNAAKPVTSGARS